MKPTLLVFGDCQAQAIARAVADDAEVAADYDVQHVWSPAPWVRAELTAPRPDLWERCAVLWRETGVDPLDESLLALLPSNTRVATFPAVWFGAPWSLIRSDDAFRSLTNYWYGKYPYSDSILLALCDTDISGPDLVIEYERLAASKLSVADANLRKSLDMTIARERDASVKLAAFIEANFRTLNLFSAIGHPRSVLLRRTIDGLAQATLDDRRYGELGSRNGLLRTSDPLRMYDFPICRAVAEHLGLHWWTEDLIYRIKDSNTAAREFTFAEYVIAYVTDRRAIRKA
jgi:hypothetical protein